MTPNKLISLTFSSLFAFFAYSQSTVDQVLLNSLQDERLDGVKAQLEYYDTHSFKSPLFRELDLRVRGNDLNDIPERYGLRLGLLNPKEIQANNNFDKANKIFLANRYNYLINQILAEKYKLLIYDYSLLLKEANLRNEAERIKSFQLSKKAIVDLDDWIKIDHSLLDAELKHAELQLEKEQSKADLAGIDSTTLGINWDRFSMIQVGQMRTVLDDAISSSKLNQLALASQALDLDRLKLSIDYAESRSNLGFLQAGYDTDGDWGLKNHLAYQVGISIPIFNKDRPKLQRDELDLIENEYQLRYLSTSNRDVDMQVFNRFNAVLITYNMLNNKYEELLVIARTGVVDVDAFISLGTYLSSVNERKDQAYIELLGYYIDILENRGILAAEPYLNYLSLLLSDLSDY